MRQGGRTARRLPAAATDRAFELALAHPQARRHAGTILDSGELESFAETGFEARVALCVPAHVGAADLPNRAVLRPDRDEDGVAMNRLPTRPSNPAWIR